MNVETLPFLIFLSGLLLLALGIKGAWPIEWPSFAEMSGAFLALGVVATAMGFILLVAA